ncbi:MAG: Hpt domain-containing protein, partial [Burkholderiaceae bacterium]|nr:Hpt domain-containing protein [Burkholderiaceae bacterium]
MAARLLQASAGAPLDEQMPQWLRVLSHAAQERLTMTSFIGEAQGNLRTAEQALDSFFRDPAQRADLPQTARQLHQVAGALRLLGPQNAAAATSNVAERVQAFAAGEAEPAGEACEAVAADLGALGFFVDSLQQAGRSSARFEFDADSGRFSAILTEVRRDPPSVVVTLDSQASAPAPAPATAEELLVGHSRRIGELFESLRREPQDAALRDALRQTIASLREDAQLADNGALKARADDAIDALDVAAAAGGSPDLDAVQAMLSACAGRRARGAPSAVPEPERDDAEIDSELLGIFLGEAQEVLEAIAEAAAQSCQAPAESSFLTTIRRGFHTLKGSSRMVGLAAFGEAAWAMEQVLNLWLAEERTGSAPLYALIELARVRFAQWVDALQAGVSFALDPAPMIAAAVALRDAQPHETAFAALADQPAVDVAAPLESIEAVEVIEAMDVVEAVDVEEMFTPEEVRIGEQTISRPLYDIFLTEADDLIATLSSDSLEWAGQPGRPASERAQRAMHSLKGSAALVALHDVQALAEQLETFLLRQRASGRLAAAQDLDDYGHAVERIQAMLHRFAAGSPPHDESNALVLAHALAARWDPRALLRGELDPDVLDELPEDEASEIPAESAEAFIEPAEAFIEPGEAFIEPADVFIEPAEAFIESDESSVGSDESLVEPAIAPALRSANELDADLLPIFVEEASDYLPQIGENLRRWLDTPADRSLQQLLMRHLHTVKGSARMAGAMDLGQLVHEMETRIEAASVLTVVPTSLIEALISDHDDVVAMFEAIRDPASRVHATAAAPAGEAPGREAPGHEAPGHEAPGHEAPGHEAPAAKSVAEPVAKAAGAAPPVPAPTALVRVRADLLDLVVNESGEVSIARSRLDNELGQLRQS